MSKRIDRDAELSAAVDAVALRGYEVRRVGAGSDGVRKWAVHKPDPTTGYNPRSYFDRDALVALALISDKRELRGAIAAARSDNNPYIQRNEENEAMKKKTTADGNGSKKTTAQSEKAAREAKVKKAADAGKAKPPAKGATRPAKKGAKAPAARAEKGDKKPGGADVQGATPELLAKLAGYQEQTIERMNSRRVVETYMRIKTAPKGEPVVHKTLSPYPQRIARELARLGLVTKTRDEELGVVYLPA
jgi:hypothetical protein